MTELTEHAKTILRAIADGKTIEVMARGEWVNASLCDVAWQLGEDCTKARIKPETRSINGVEFAAPITGDGFDLNISTGASYLDNRCFVFARSEDRNTAYQAIVSALTGENK